MADVIHSPVAWTVPFESEPERNNGLVSKTVQEAIEEVKGLAESNERFLVLPQYNGNANTGRYLEFFAGIDSSDAPLVFASAASIISIICSTTSPSSDATLGFYNLFADPGATTPLYTLDMNNQKTKIDTGLPLFIIPTNGLLAVKVDSASILKPHVQVVFSSI